MQWQHFSVYSCLHLHILLNISFIFSILTVTQWCLDSILNNARSMCFQSVSSWGLENVLLKCPSLKQCFAHKFNAWSMFLLCRFCIWGCKNVQSFSKQRQTPTNRKWLTNWKPWHVLRICTCTYVQCGYLIAAFSLAMQKDTIIPSCIHGFF